MSFLFTVTDYQPALQDEVILPHPAETTVSREYETWAATQNGDASARVLGDRLKPYHIVECTLFLGPGTDRDVLSRRFRAALSLCAAQALGGKRPTIPRTAFTRVLCQSV